MSAVKYDEDLFADTTMTFGEHLEELRSALLKGLAGLVIGVLLGLYVGDRIVALISKPLHDALVTYYQSGAVEKYEALKTEVEAQGFTLDYTLEQVADLVENKGMIYELRYVDSRQLEMKPGEPAFDASSGQGGASAAGGGALTALRPVLLWHPVQQDDRTRLITLSASEAFSIWMKAALVVGVIISSPWVFYHIWSFVAAGLYPHEKRYVHIFLPFSLGLFLLGAATAYLFVFQPVLNFLLGFNRWLNLDPDPRMSEWLSFVLLLPLGFGASFQLPLVMLFLERIGIFDITAYLKKWRISILVIFILSAVLTPADPYSLLLMALPLCFLYFGGILLCYLMPRSKSEFETD